MLLLPNLSMWAGGRGNAGGQTRACDHGSVLFAMGSFPSGLISVLDNHVTSIMAHSRWKQARDAAPQSKSLITLI